MTPDLVSAEYAGGYRVRLVYEDGTCAVVDLGTELRGGVFEPLKDPAFFKSFRLTEGRETIEWPNGADFAPEFLYEKANAPRS